MKHRATRERLEAEMRLRHSEAMLERLRHRLDITRHPEGDPYRKAKLAEFWQKVGIDRRIAKGEL